MLEVKLKFHNFLKWRKLNQFKCFESQSQLQRKVIELVFVSLDWTLSLSNEHSSPTQECSLTLRQQLFESEESFTLNQKSKRNQRCTSPLDIKQSWELFNSFQLLVKKKRLTLTMRSNWLNISTQKFFQRYVIMKKFCLDKDQKHLLKFDRRNSMPSLTLSNLLLAHL